MLKDRTAVITGAGSGIGEATARLFAREGASLALLDMDEAGVKRVAGELSPDGSMSLPLKANVSIKGEVEAAFKAAATMFGKVDILVNNAGINRDSFLKKMDEAQWDSVLAVNLKGTFLCCQAALPFMSEKNYGRIVNTASVGMLGNPGQANYAASKAGVVGLTHTLALELARYGITVNCVAPGATMTPMFSKVPPEFQDKMKERIPLKRFASPDEVARAHLFFADEKAGYITGQVLFVDGGLSTGI